MNSRQVTFIILAVFLLSLQVVYADNLSSKDIPEDFPIKEGMTKEEVIDKAGEPFKIIGQDDPLYLEHKQEQKEKYGFVTEIWYYAFPVEFTLYFKDGKVSRISYKGESEALEDMKEKKKVLEGEKDI